MRPSILTADTIYSHGDAYFDAERHSPPVAATDPHERLAQALPELLDALRSLALGTATTTREHWVAAGTLTAGTGPHTCLLTPQLPPDQLVLVSRETTPTKPNTEAALFLLNRLLE